jgi:DNA-binding XRE family transcriptional regulator
MSDIPVGYGTVVHRRDEVICELPYEYDIGRPHPHQNRSVAAQRRREPTWEEFGREIGVRLQRARERAGLSQERTAHLAGIASYTYQKFEKGESRPGSPLNPRLSTLVALCRVLDVRLEDLLPDPPPTQPLVR